MEEQVVRGLQCASHLGVQQRAIDVARIARRLSDGVGCADAALDRDLESPLAFCGYGRNVEYRRLLVAPRTLRAGIRDLIRGEAAAGPGRGRIIMKMNSLVDAEMIDELYDASQAGVEVDLIVRGICCLTPGVAGLSENIRVRSLVGRYLEHSRLYYFANGGPDGEARYLIGSADIMPRNLDRRVEALVPVTDPELMARLREVLDLELADDVLAWVLGPDGRWERVPPGGTLETHVEMQRRTIARNNRLTVA